MLGPGFVVLVAVVPVFVVLWAAGDAFPEGAGALAVEEVSAGASACEVAVAAGFVARAVADGFALVEVAAGACFASGVVFEAGLAGAEAADESFVALESGVCCAGELAACGSLLAELGPAWAGDKKIVAAARMAAMLYIKVDGLEKVGFFIPIFWHPTPPHANCLTPSGD